jgi:hypothetical protein
MWALAAAVLVILAFGGQIEGTIKIPGILSSVTFARFGRVSIGAWSYRPGRLYYKVAIG